MTGGLGSVAPDGSPVELYLVLPGDAEAAFIHNAIGVGTSILELGCGAGRVTRHLVAFGHDVAAVDNSEAMLAEVRQIQRVEPVLAEIGALDLTPRRWPVVLLASHLINDENGSEFLAAAARHVATDGCVLVQRHEPGWIDDVEESISRRPDLTIEMLDIRHLRRGAMSAVMSYEIRGELYRQPFIAYEVDDARLDAMAKSAGLVVESVIDDDRKWIRLRPDSAAMSA